MMTTTERIDAKLTELGITDRAEIAPGSFGWHLHLRAAGFDSRYHPGKVRARVTVPAMEQRAALALLPGWLTDRTDPVADGRKALRLWEQKGTADV